MKIFNISYPGNNEKLLLSVMRDYKLNTTWLNSNIGQDIVYQASLDKELLIDSSIKYISLLETSRRYRGGLYRGQSYYNYLSTFFPDAIFLLYELNDDDFIKNQFESGYIKDIVFHYKLSEQESIDQLLMERKHHISLVRNYFKGSDRLLYLSGDDINTLQKLHQFLSYHNQVDGEFAISSRSSRLAFRSKSLAINRYKLENNNSANLPSLTIEKFNEIVNQLVDHCVKDISSKDGKTTKYGVSVSWDPITGSISPSKVIIRSLTGDFVTNSKYNWKMRRVVGVMNDLEHYGCRLKVIIDMQDARLFGDDDITPLSDRVVTYCCRVGAKNIILWPLPGYHTIGFDNFPGGFSSDDLPFNKKKNVAIWRGALSGPCSDVINGEYEKAAQVVIQQLLKKLSVNECIKEHVDTLLCNLRVSFVCAYHSSTKVDAGIVLNKDQLKLKDTSLKKIIAERLTHVEIFKYKYIICLRGFDTASNFLMAASSNSVALKEEDGWEVFYSCLFKPWVHYIPLAPGGKDVLEKINWAEKNEDKVKEIISNANYACSLLARKDIRQSMCVGIINRLNLSESN